MIGSSQSNPPKRNQELLLATLRVVIGWHFLYEGWTKLINPAWSAGGYLRSATGPLAGAFHWLASQTNFLGVIDALNVWGLFLIGLALMFGLLVRLAAIGGVTLLGMYYLAHPPLFSPVPAGAAEGEYLIVNKNLVELLALVVVWAYPARTFGMAALLDEWKRKRGTTPSAAKAAPAEPGGLSVAHAAGAGSRRRVLQSLLVLPVFGGFVAAVLKKHGWRSFEEIHLRSRPDPRNIVVASATTKRFQYSTLRDLKGHVPHTRIGNLRVSRLILGGNLIGGWAHARDLLYVSNLVQAYHTRSKIFETLDLAEACGINALITNPVLCEVINDYWRAGGKIQFISDCGFGNILDMVRKSVDRGACSCYIQGGTADGLAAKGKFDLMAKALELTRQNGVPAGIGAHKLATVQGCVEAGLRPDYWMKTLHPLTYWSAKVQPEHDNSWCEDPEATIRYMAALEAPWIAFKVLGAGAIKPEFGFRYALENGADLLCVGMYDFQIVDDVNIFLAVLNGNLRRQRRWYA